MPIDYSQCTDLIRAGGLPYEPILLYPNGKPYAGGYIAVTDKEVAALLKMLPESLQVRRARAKKAWVTRRANLAKRKKGIETTRAVC